MEIREQRSASRLRAARRRSWAAAHLVGGALHDQVGLRSVCAGLDPGLGDAARPSEVSGAEHVLRCGRMNGGDMWDLSEREERAPRGRAEQRRDLDARIVLSKRQPQRTRHPDSAQICAYLGLGLSGSFQPHLRHRWWALARREDHAGGAAAQARLRPGREVRPAGPRRWAAERVGWQTCRQRRRQRDRPPPRRFRYGDLVGLTLPHPVAAPGD